MKKIVLGTAIISSFLGVNAFAEINNPSTKTSDRFILDCETGKTAKEAASKINQFLYLYSTVSAPTVTVTAPGEVTICVTHK